MALRSPGGAQQDTV